MAKATEATEVTVDYDNLISQCQARIAEALSKEAIELEESHVSYVANKARIRTHFRLCIDEIKKAIVNYTREKKKAAK